MSNIEIAIKYSKAIEKLLTQIYGATGKGLHEKLTSVETQLNPAFVRSARYVATIRNKVVHEDGYVLDDPAGFEQTCSGLVSALEAQLPKPVLVHAAPSVVTGSVADSTQPLPLPLQPLSPAVVAWRTFLLVATLAGGFMVLRAALGNHLAIRWLGQERVAELCLQTNACTNGRLYLEKTPGSPTGYFNSTHGRRLQITANAGQWDQTRFLAGLSFVERSVLEPLVFSVKAGNVNTNLNKGVNNGRR